MQHRLIIDILGTLVRHTGNQMSKTLYMFQKRMVTRGSPLILLQTTYFLVSEGNEIDRWSCIRDKFTKHIHLVFMSFYTDIYISSH